MSTSIIDFDTIINSSKFRFKVGLFNTDNRYQELKPGAIKQLVIEDIFFNYFHKGYIILNNTFDAVERVSGITVGSNPSSLKQQQGRGFIFKGDSRDILSIDIMPKLDEQPFSSKNSKQGDEIFRLFFNFAIYNSEEIPGENAGEKFKKLFFWDLYYELLLEKNSYFSTGNYVSLSGNNADNTERTVFTGDAVKNFLQEFFSPEDGLPITIGEPFDQGSTNVFFSAPAKFKGIDCLEYLLSRHVSSADSNYDRAFLRLGRGNPVFKFESLKDIFSKSVSVDSSGIKLGEYYLETFKIGTYSDVNNEYTLEKLQFTPSNALFFQKFGTIQNFSYDFMPGLYSQQEIATFLVHSYDFDDKTFSIEEERNTASSSLSTYNQNYVLPFSKYAKQSAYSNFLIGKYREENKNVKHSFTVSDNPNQRLNAGRNSVLFNSIFLNNTVLFKVPGSTHREAGKFIGIDRDGSYEYTDFDNKMLGVYFIVEVKHIFSGGDYYNELRCIKTYSSKDIFINKESK